MQPLVQSREGEIQALSQYFEFLTHLLRILTRVLTLKECERVVLLCQYSRLQPHALCWNSLCARVAYSNQGMTIAVSRWKKSIYDVDVVQVVDDQEPVHLVF